METEIRTELQQIEGVIDKISSLAAYIGNAFSAQGRKPEVVFLSPSRGKLTYSLYEFNLPWLDSIASLSIKGDMGSIPPGQIERFAIEFVDFDGEPYTTSYEVSRKKITVRIDGLVECKEAKLSTPEGKHYLKQLFQRLNKINIPLEVES